METNQEYLMHTYNQNPVTFCKGEDIYLIDTEGNKYLDFGAGIAVNALGYSCQPLKDALKKQVDELLHCSNLYFNDEQLKAVEKVAKRTQMDKVFFCNSGAEAMEGSMKLARKYARYKGYEERYEIITMKNSFHGRTLGAISATGQTKYQKGLDPLLQGIKYVEYNNIEALKEAVSEKTCAIMMEVIQGEGGIIEAEPEFMQAARDLCDSKDMVLIFDEVQTGMGRTGYPCAYMKAGIKPDIIGLAKGIASGVPTGAVVAKASVAEAFHPGDHASTFGGNPLAMSAVNVMMEIGLSDEMMVHVREMGDYLHQKLQEIVENHDIAIGTRGTGLIQGLVIEGTPSEIVKKAFDKKLLVVGAGANVIRFVPPLVVTKEDIDKCMTILKEVL